MKNRWPRIVLYFWIMLTTTLLNADVLLADYCASNGNSVNWEYISSITVGDFTKNSGSNGGYADYTGDVVELSQGVNNVLLVPGFRSGSYTEYWSIWVDLNQDDVFSGGEQLYVGSSRSSITADIEIPVSALSGQTRMRISMRYGGAPPACGSFSYGEVEDYTANIAGTTTGPPTVQSTTPINNAILVPIDATITATFNKPMDPLTLDDTTFVVTQGPQTVSGTLTYSGVIATFTPDAPFIHEAAYDVTITTGVADLEGTALSTPVSWSFTAEPVPDTTPPEIISTSPAADAMDISVDSQVVVTFTEAVNPATLTPASFYLSGASGPVPGTIVSIGANATFTPMTRLLFDHDYSFTITAAVSDPAGNPLASDLSFGFTTAVPGPGDMVEQKITAADLSAYAYFGNAVAVSDHVAVIGAHGDNENGSYSGSAYVYRKDGSAWLQTAKLLAGDGAAYDYFGFSVAVDGNTIVIGKHYDDTKGTNAGAAYVFEYIDDTWTQTAKLTATDGATSDMFGYSAAVAGNQIIIGAYGDDDLGSSSGSAYVYEKTDGVWTQTAKLSPDNGAAYGYFSRALSMVPNRVLIGSYGDIQNGPWSGSAYLYEKMDGVWTQTNKFIAEDGLAYDWFGYAVALSGERVIISAPYDDKTYANDGSVYLFEKVDGLWQSAGVLTAPDGAGSDYFGSALDLDGDRAVIGAYGDDDTGSNSGSAYLFEKTEGTWQMDEKLVAFDAAVGDYFGAAVALSGHQVIVGAKYHYVASVRTGAAYAFNLPDTVPPMVSSVTPDNGAINVAVNESIVANFTEKMDPASMGGDTFQVNDGSTNISGSITVDGSSVVFAPDAELLHETVYSATITTDAQDLAGNPLGDAFTWTFTTGQYIDITPPEITEHTPLADADDVAVNTSISVVFSEPIDTTTVTAASFTVSDGVNTIAGTISAIDQTATFTPDTQLAWETSHTVTVTTDVQDLAGNPLADEETWDFTTGAEPDTIAPTVTSSIPQDNAIDVLPDTAVSITFSEEMDPATITTASVTLSSGSGPISGTVDYQGGQATFTPTAPLVYSVDYTLTVTADAADLAGNTLLAPFEITFTTMDEPVVYSVTLYPAAAGHGQDGGELNGWVVDGIIDSITECTDYDQAVFVQRYRSMDFTKYSELRGLYEFDFGAALPDNITIVSATLILDTAGGPSGNPSITVSGYAGDGEAQISDFDLGAVLDTVSADSDDLTCDVTSFLTSIVNTEDHIGLILESSIYYWEPWNSVSFWNGTPHPIYGHMSDQLARLIVEYSPQ